MSDRTLTAADELAGEPAKGSPHTDAGDDGYNKDLKSRHINMIAIGGAIGTGLFMGAGGRMRDAGPSLFIAYAICGVFAFFVVRALGELVLYRPSSGAFVSYAREFMGEKGAYSAGWLYFLNWSTTTVADITAAAVFAHYWSFFSDVPQWILAMIALAIVLTANLISVKYFGEMEFWFSIIKVAALVLFMLIGIFLVVTQHEVGGHTPGLATMSDNGGIFPNGMMPMLLLIQGVVFAYASVELCGVAAGETKNPEKIMPKAINSIMWRVGVFYVGSVVLLALLLPYTAYSGDQSPFVTVFDKLGIPGAADIMNLVVLTAALSSLNSGLYSTGRILRSMSVAGSAPKFVGVMNKGGVPYGGVLFTAAFGVMGVGLNYWMPKDAFELVINFASIGILGTWGMIMLCSLLFWRAAKDGKVTRPGYNLPWAPYTQIVTLVFLVSVVFLMWHGGGIGRTTINCLPLIAAALVGGWFLVRKRVAAVAAERAE